MSESLITFWNALPHPEKAMVDCLRRLVLKTLPGSCKEKLTYQVPFYYLNKRVCLIWPASVKGGGIQSGVLFGFAQGNRLPDPDGYLTHGTNKKIFYRVYNSLEDIDEKALVKLLHQAIEVDNSTRTSRLNL